jgi:hypothetical protein
MSEKIQIVLGNSVGQRGPLRGLRDQIAHEDDPEKLLALVMEINGLLDLIESQVAKLESRPSHKN